MASDLEEALVAFLKADPAVTAMIGMGNNARIYPETAPQNATFPYLTYSVVDWPEDQPLSGPNGFCWPRIQIDCWVSGRTAYRDVKTLSKVVRNCRGGMPQGRTLNGFSGDMHGVKVHCCKLLDRQAIPELPQNGEEGPIRRISLDFQFQHDEQ